LTYECDGLVWTSSVPPWAKNGCWHLRIGHQNMIYTITPLQQAITPLLLLIYMIVYTI